MPEWDTIAPYYDVLFDDRTVDIPFWVSMCQRFGSPVLEFASGTGRLTIPMANAGVKIVGIDISAPMLAYAKKAIRKQSSRIQRNIELIKADVTQFSFPGKKFQAVFSPWGFVPVTKEQQDGLFRSVRSHLVPNGHFVIDVGNVTEPTEDWNYTRLKEFKQLPGKQGTLIRQAHNRGFALTKRGQIIFRLDIVKPNGTSKVLLTERNYRLYTVRDMKSLLVEHGFRIAHMFGDYDFSPWTPTSKLAIFDAQMTALGTIHWIRNSISALNL